MYISLISRYLFQKRKTGSAPPLSRPLELKTARYSNNIRGSNTQRSVPQDKFVVPLQIEGSGGDVEEIQNLTESISGLEESIENIRSLFKPDTSTKEKASLESQIALFEQAIAQLKVMRDNLR